MDSAPEDRAMTVGLCKRLGIWPLDSRHKPEGQCLCASCFAGEPTAEVVVLAKRKRAKAFMWEEDAA